MIAEETTALQALFHEDETAWLEAMAQLIAERRLDLLDHDHLREYLIDMAKRDRREVLSRLIVLLTHLLKWEHQAEGRSRSWRGSIREQRRELKQLLESGTLRNHALHVLATAYEEARLQAADETGLPIDTFPAECSSSLDELLSPD